MKLYSQCRTRIDESKVKRVKWRLTKANKKNSSICNGICMLNRRGTKWFNSIRFTKVQWKGEK